jgi:NADH-quinone oxidoreductase subunit E
MNKPLSSTSCQTGCWVLAAASGAVVLAVCFFLIELGILASIFMSAVVFIVVGLLLGWIFCSELKPLVQSTQTTDTPKAREPAPAAEPTAAAGPAPAAEPTAAAGPAPVAANVSASASATPDVETAEEAARPEALSSARAGGADDLKMIKGVGPKLEIMLNDLGFYHFDQIAAWSAAEVAWVNDNLAGFKGRVSRDNWVEQARKLATGQETEFSKRVSDGDVY